MYSTRNQGQRLWVSSRTSCSVHPCRWMALTVGPPQIRGDCGRDSSNGTASSSPSSSSSVSSAHTYWDYTVGSAEDQGSSRGYYGGVPGRTNSDSNGPIRNGRRHPVCGGEYLDDCDLGPYLSVDVGDGSCQQHLNTEGCHYDGGKLLPVGCTQCG